MKLPDFLVIGAAKAGTSALYRYLEQHPQIYASPVKEPHFFGLEGNTHEFQGPLGAEVKENKAVYHIEAYRKLFQNAPSEARVFEASVSYLYLPQAAYRIKFYLPKVKLIVMLRNPVERAFSSFLYLMRDAREPLEDFNRGLKAEPERIQNNWGFLYRYTDLGFYADQLSTYYDVFEPEQIKVFLYDDFKADSLKVLREAFDFVSVDAEFQPDTSRKFNVSGLPKNKAMHKLIAEKNILKALIKPMIPRRLRYRFKENYYETNLSKPILLNETRQHLIEVFRKDILKLEELLGRDLSMWLK